MAAEWAWAGALSARRTARRARGQADLPKRKPNLKKLWPQIKALVAPRKGLLVAGMGLMVINRVAGLVLPLLSKPLLDKVLSRSIRGPICCPASSPGLFGHGGAGHHLVLADATALQGRPAADCRDAPQVQRHVGLLSVSYYDENRTGTLVARIMTDVEGVRNLVGTGLVEFVGGLLTAVLAFLYLLHLSVDGHADGLRGDGRVRLCPAVWLQGRFAPSSASAARSTPRSRAG
jgi:ABC-type multidrug transport system fused ATPase/permease subunit